MSDRDGHVMKDAAERRGFVMNQGHSNLEGFSTTGDIKKDAQLLFELGVSRETATAELYGIYYTGSRDKTQQLVIGAIAVCYGPEKRG